MSENKIVIESSEDVGVKSDSAVSLSDTLDNIIQESREEYFFGQLRFYVYKLNSDEIAEFDRKLKHIAQFFPESFRNPYSGSFLEKDFAVSSTDSDDYIFKIKDTLSDGDLKPFFALKLRENKKFNINAMKNDGTLFILTVLELLLSINSESVRFSALSTIYPRGMIQLLLAKLLSNYEEKESV